MRSAAACTRLTMASHEHRRSSWRTATSQHTERHLSVSADGTVPNVPRRYCALVSEGLQPPEQRRIERRAAPHIPGQLHYARSCAAERALLAPSTPGCSPRSTANSRNSRNFGSLLIDLPCDIVGRLQIGIMHPASEPFHNSWVCVSFINPPLHCIPSKPEHRVLMAARCTVQHN